MVDGWAPDRRRSERREVRFPLYARVVDATTGQPVQAAPVRVSGLSVGGMVLESGVLLPAGHRLSLTIETATGDVGPLTGRVVHSRLVLAQQAAAAPSYVAGLAFDPLPAETTGAIEALLSSTMQHPAPDRAQQAP